MNKDNMNVIWDSDINISEWEDFLEEEAEERGVKLEDIDEYERLDWINETNRNYLDDERSNLDVELDNVIIGIADIGRWNGRCPGYKIFKSNINDILSSECEVVKWYSDGKDIKCKESHHDGSNFIIYREVKQGVDMEELEVAALRGLSDEEIEKYTVSILDKVAKVYGW